ncbi:MAG: 3'-5' exonuclease [Vicinamibacterales bacterium]
MPEGLCEQAGLPRLQAVAAARGQVVTVLDLETTEKSPAFANFGITEVAMLHVYPDGRVTTITALVNPERSIPIDATALTGIRECDVQGKPAWVVWAGYLIEVARAHVTVGFHSRGFDCQGIIRQNERYGAGETVFGCHLDIADLPPVSGTLAAMAARYGIPVESAHRAMSDVWTTARLAERMLSELGGGVIQEHLDAVRRMSSRSERRDDLLTHYGRHSALPDLSQFAVTHGVKLSTAQNDALSLVDEGHVPAAVLVDYESQEWSAEHVASAIEHVWQGEQDGKLKPLMEALMTVVPAVPGQLDYLQLRLALRLRAKL